MSEDLGEGQQWYREAAYWFNEEAISGVPVSANNLGYLYAKGLGVQENAETAAQWFEEAAEFGSIAALYNLGVCYLNGWGVVQSDETAVTYFERASDKNDASAASVLAYLYLEGRGVNRDPSKSFEYNMRAAAQAVSKLHLRLDMRWVLALAPNAISPKASAGLNSPQARGTHMPRPTWQCIFAIHRI